MKAQEPNSLFDQLIDEAIAEDRKQQPDIFYAQKVMSNIYSISKSREIYMHDISKPNFSFRMAVIYGLSIAASICIGYFIGSININPAESAVMVINFDNININSILAY